MSEEKKSPSTKQLVAESEALRGQKAQKVPATRQLIDQAEELIGRAPRKSPLRGIVAVLVLVAAAAAGWLVWGSP